jgi:hypothetical protein
MPSLERVGISHAKAQSRKDRHLEARAALFVFASLRDRFAGRDKNATSPNTAKNHKKLKDSAASFVHRMVWRGTDPD